MSAAPVKVAPVKVAPVLAQFLALDAMLEYVYAMLNLGDEVADDDPARDEHRVAGAPPPHVVADDTLALILPALDAALADAGSAAARAGRRRLTRPGLVALAKELATTTRTDVRLPRVFVLFAHALATNQLTLQRTGSDPMHVGDADRVRIAHAFAANGRYRQARVVTRSVNSVRVGWLAFLDARLATARPSLHAFIDAQLATAALMPPGWLATYHSNGQRYCRLYAAIRAHAPVATTWITGMEPYTNVSNGGMVYYSTSTGYILKGARAHFFYMLGVAIMARNHEFVEATHANVVVREVIEKNVATSFVTPCHFHSSKCTTMPTTPLDMADVYELVALAPAYARAATLRACKRRLKATMTFAGTNALAPSPALADVALRYFAAEATLMPATRAELFMELLALPPVPAGDAHAHLYRELLTAPTSACTHEARAEYVLTRTHRADAVYAPVLACALANMTPAVPTDEQLIGLSTELHSGAYSGAGAVRILLDAGVALTSVPRYARRCVLTDDDNACVAFGEGAWSGAEFFAQARDWQALAPSTTCSDSAVAAIIRLWTLVRMYEVPIPAAFLRAAWATPAMHAYLITHALALSVPNLVTAVRSCTDDVATARLYAYSLAQHAPFSPARLLSLVSHAREVTGRRQYARYYFAALRTATAHVSLRDHLAAASTTAPTIHDCLISAYAGNVNIAGADVITLSDAAAASRKRARDDDKDAA